ncbi:MAG: hypothetical protein AVDCRST_MAG10-2081, partial [uncultured Acidimicrobiales bacterium]
VRVRSRHIARSGGSEGHRPRHRERPRARPDPHPLQLHPRRAGCHRPRLLGVRGVRCRGTRGVDGHDRHRSGDRLAGQRLVRPARVVRERVGERHDQGAQRASPYGRL